MPRMDARGWAVTKGFVAVAFFILLTACSTTSQVLDLDVQYKNDLLLEINGIWARGTVTVPMAQSYKIRAISYDPIDMIKWSTCHREESTEEVKGSLFQSPGKEYTFTIKPNELELANACPLKIETYTKSPRGRHGSALVEFGNKRLKFRVLCNGKTIEAVQGVAICETAQSLTQQIITDSVSIVEAGSDNCDVITKEKDKYFTFKTPKKECVYAIMSLDGEEGRLVTIGYDQIAIRGE